MVNTLNLLRTLNLSDADVALAMCWVTLSYALIQRAHLGSMWCATTESTIPPLHPKIMCVIGVVRYIHWGRLKMLKITMEGLRALEKKPWPPTLMRKIFLPLIHVRRTYWFPIPTIQNHPQLFPIPTRSEPRLARTLGLKRHMMMLKSRGLASDLEANKFLIRRPNSEHRYNHQGAASRSCMPYHPRLMLTVVSKNH